MSVTRISTAGLLVAVACAAGVGIAQDQKVRETARAGVSSVRSEVASVIPNVPPLCDGVQAKKMRVNVGDSELYVEVEGQGTPIVLLHGGPGATHHGFHPEFSRAAAFAQVIYYDQRGCGSSDYKPGSGYSLAQAADDLDKLRISLGIKKWIVVGHSYGGLLGQYYSTRYPESLIGLVLVGASVPAPGVQLKPTRQYEYMSKDERSKIREIYANKQLDPARAVFNAHLNGDWKRQNYYRPSDDDVARMAQSDTNPHWSRSSGWSSGRRRPGQKPTL